MYFFPKCNPDRQSNSDDLVRLVETVSQRRMFYFATGK